MDLIIISGKGGTAKTTTAVAAALGYQQQGYKVGIVDCDRAHSVAINLGIDERAVGSNHLTQSRG